MNIKHNKQATFVIYIAQEHWPDTAEYITQTAELW